MQSVDKQQENKQKVSKTVTDLKLIKHLRSNFTEIPKRKAQNILQLKQVLKNHNTKFKNYEGRLQLSIAWMKSMNVNMDRIVQDFRHQKRITENLLLKKRQEEDTSEKQKPLVITEKPFQFPTITLENQGKFVKLQHQFIIHDMVSKNLSNIVERESQFINRANARWSNQYYDYSQPQVSTQGNKSRDNRSSIKQYFEIVKNAVDCNQYDSILSGFLTLSKGSPHQKYWQILSTQANSSIQENPVYSLMLNSLQLLEEEIESNLQTDLQKLDTSLGHKGFGVAYTYYKAGKKIDFYKILSNKNMRKMLSSFQQYEAKIQQGRLNEKETWFDQEDVCEEGLDFYYEQLIYILQGQKRVSNEKICDPYTLDFAWIVLRIYGIHLMQNGETDRPISKSQQKKIKEYKRFLQGIRENYKANASKLNTAVLKNIFYLSDYPTLLSLYETHKNELLKRTNIDQPFFLHLLMVLYYNPHPFLQLSPYEDFQAQIIPQALANRIRHYVIDLISSKNQEFIDRTDPLLPAYYILTIPLDKWIDTIPRIFSNISQFTRFYLTGAWDFVRDKISEINTQTVSGLQIFQDSVRQTLQRLIRTTKDENQLLQIATYFQKISNPVEKLQILMALLINKTCQFDVDQNCLVQSGQRGVYYEDLLNQTNETLQVGQLGKLQSSYELIFNFIITFNQIRTLSRKGLKKQAHEVIYNKCKDYLTFNQSNQQALTDKFCRLIQIIQFLNRKHELPIVSKVEEFTATQYLEIYDQNIRLIMIFLRMVSSVEEDYFYSQGISTRQVRNRIKAVGKLAQDYATNQIM